MPLVRLIKPGFTNFTGALHTTLFVDGLSESVTVHVANIIGANIEANIVTIEDDVETIVGRAGDAAGIPSTTRL